MFISAVQLDPKHLQESIDLVRRHPALTALEPAEMDVIDAGGPSDLNEGPLLYVASCGDLLVDLHPELPGPCLKDRCLTDRLATVYGTRQGATMSIRQRMILAREMAGMSQEDLAASSGWDKGNISKLENGTKGANLDSIDRWFTACGMSLVVLPSDRTATPEELDALPSGLRDLALRFVRLLPYLDAKQDALTTFRGLIEFWEAQQNSATERSASQRAGSGS